ncbi:twitching motility protein PilT [Bacteroidia bacterium]|nr:twitching motility protein PilT [Bacteroidia bacterium]
MMKVLIDTNIIMDIALERSPFYNHAIILFQKIHDKQLQGSISASTVTDIFYLVQREKGRQTATCFLKKLIKVIDIIGVDKDTIVNALQLEWNDFEDAVQAQVALENEIDIIITRNAKDFQEIKNIKVFSPVDFINFLPS